MVSASEESATVLVSLTAGVAGVEIVSVSEALTAAPEEGEPLAVAGLTTEPLATSAATTLWVAAGSCGQVVLAPAARVATQAALVSPTLASVTVTLLRGRLPVLVTLKP